MKVLFLFNGFLKRERLGSANFDGFRNPSKQLIGLVHPIIYRSFYVAGGCLGILPSTVGLHLVNMFCLPVYPDPWDEFQLDSYFLQQD